MAQMMSIPVLGLIENYSYYQCPDCGAKHAIFGESHLEQEAMQLGLPCWPSCPSTQSWPPPSIWARRRLFRQLPGGRGGAAGRVRGASNVRRGGTAQTEHRARGPRAAGPFIPFVLWGRLTEADRQYKNKETADNSNTGALGAIPG